MSFQVTIRTEGLDGVDGALARLTPIDGQSLLSGLGRLIREQTVARIQSGGPAPGGEAWRPNLERRTPILHRSGALARSIDYRAGASQLVVGSGLVYAAIHQFGGVIRPKDKPRLAFRIGNRLVFAGSVTMPKRPYLGLSAEDRQEAARAVVLFLRKALR